MQLRIPQVYKNDKTLQSILRHYGDEITTTTNKGHTRIAFQNINGMERAPQPAQEVIDTIREYDIDIFGAAETTCDWTDELQHSVLARIQHTFGNGILSHSSAKHPNKNGYLPGGVMEITTGTMCGRQPKQGKDDMGRYTWQTYTGKNEKKICFITAYRVSQAKTFTGIGKENNTAHRQQMTALLEKGIISPDPKQQILEDLERLIDKLTQDGHEIILMMDANESTKEKGSKLKTFIDKAGLNDVHEYNHDTSPHTTRIGSSKIIDYIFASDGLIEYISKCGHLALNEGVISDHILLWADIDTKSFFAGDAPKITLPGAREFQFRNSIMRERFLTELDTFFDHQNIRDRIEKMCRGFEKDGPTKDMIKNYNAIDRDITQAIKAAARRTTKKNYGYHRSPALSEIGYIVLFWRIALKIKQGRAIICERIKKVAAKAGLDIDKAIAMPISKIYTKINEARKEQRQVQNHAKEIRIQFLNGIARTKAAEDDEQAEKEIRQAIKQMHIVSMHQKLTRIIKGKRGGLDYVEIPTGEWYYSHKYNELYHYDQGLFECHVSHEDTENLFYHHSSLKVPPSEIIEVEINKHIHGISIINGYKEPIEWRKVTEKEEMEAVIQQRNKKHLQQAAMEEAPPYQPQLKAIFDHHGCGPNSTKLLNGELTKEIEKFPTVVRTWLKNLQRDEKEKKCKRIEGWITEKEFRLAFNKVKEKTSSSPSGIHYTFWKCIANSDKFSSWMATMMSLPFVYGFVNERWTYSIDVMLEKVRGVRKIHRLRIIGLVEADFNTALKIFFAKKLVQNSEKTDLTEEQWARPNRTAMDPAFRKMLGFEYARVMFVTLIFFANDATACFDRMVPDISSIIARKYGVDINIMKCRNQVLAQLKRSLRTLHGDSDTHYKQEENELPMAGEYQGKADAAPLWSCETHSFLKTHQQLIQGAFMPHVIDKTLAIKKNNDAYVDDDDMTNTKTGNNFKLCAQELTQHAQKGAQLWNDIIFLSGGSVAHHKSMWQGISFDDSTFPPTIKKNYPGEIYLKDRKGVKTKIERLSSSQPNKGLGCHLAPDGSQHGSSKHEFETRLSQIKEISNKVRTHKLTPHEAHNIMYGRVMTSVGYSAAITQFTSKQCKELNTPINDKLLPKIKYNRHMPHAVIYSPLRLGGSAWPSFQIKQDTDSILTLIKHLRWNGTVGQDMLVVLSAWQLASGLCTPLLQDVNTKLEHLERGWFIHLRTRLSNMDARIWIENEWHPKIQRQNDQEIMRLFVNLPKITPSKIKKLNYVRMWLRVITLADITDNQGTNIPAEKFNGKWRATSKITWPDIPKPPQAEINSFKATLRKCIAPPESAKKRSNAIKLAQPLGNWIQEVRHIMHEYYRTHTQVFEYTQNEYKVYDKTSKNVYKYKHTTKELPIDAIPTQVGKRDNKVWTNDTYKLEHPIKLFNSVSEQRVPNNGKPKAGSDGSVDPLTGAYATAYQVYTGTELITGKQRAPDCEYATSYRSELLGEYLTTKCIRKNILEEISQTCDNQRAIAVIDQPIYNPTKMLDPEMDLILAIKHERKQMEHPSKLKWIKGHQDKNIPYEKMNQEQKINIDTDRISKQERTTGPVTNATPYPGSGAMLIINDKWVTTSYRERICQAITEKAHKKYFLKKFQLTEQEYNNISWKHIGLARRNIKHELNSRISKYMYNWLNTGHQKEIFGKIGICPCCAGCEETQIHIFQCKNPDVIRTRNESIKTFHTFMTQKKVHPDISGTIIELIRSLFNKKEPKLDTTNKTINKAVSNQKAIGIELMARGFISKTWIEAMQCYTKDKIDTKIKYIIHGLWYQVMEPIWQQRNNILHKKDNIVTTLEHKQLDSELNDWKVLSNERLHHSQSHLVNYTKSDFKRWTLQHKKNTLHILQEAHKNYKEYIDKEDKLQMRITSFIRHKKRT